MPTLPASRASGIARGVGGRPRAEIDSYRRPLAHSSWVNDNGRWYKLEKIHRLRQGPGKHPAIGRPGCRQETHVPVPAGRTSLQPKPSTQRGGSRGVRCGPGVTHLAERAKGRLSSGREAWIGQEHEKCRSKARVRSGIERRVPAELQDTFRAGTIAGIRRISGIPRAWLAAGGAQKQNQYPDSEGDRV
jgi:hypothetical protein